MLADIDEWGQTITVEVLMRYARANFEDPGRGSTYIANKQCDILGGGAGATGAGGTFGFGFGGGGGGGGGMSGIGAGIGMGGAASMLGLGGLGDGGYNPSAGFGLLQPTYGLDLNQDVNGFYGGGDDDDDDDVVGAAAAAAKARAEAEAKKKKEEEAAAAAAAAAAGDNDEDDDNDDDDVGPKPMDTDLRLLLASTLPLLRSRNASVVMSVSSMHLSLGLREPHVMLALVRPLLLSEMNPSLSLFLRRFTLAS